MNKSRLQSGMIWLIAFGLLAPWFAVQIELMLNGNVSWLLIAADRMLHGQSLSVSIYETNPPLSIILYTPHIIFSWLTGLPIPGASLVLSFILITLSLLATAQILKNFDFLEQAEKRTVLFGLLTSLTTITTIYFLDREHLMMMALVPFLLCQYALTHHIKISKCTLYPVLVLGAITILVKPHYGLLASLMLVHRMIAQKKFNIFCDPDFIALSVGTLTYLALALTLFRDYVNIILPDVMDFYIKGVDKRQTMSLFQPHFMAYMAVFFVELFMEDLDKQKKRFLLFLYICALLALVPLLVQMKGFYNHLMPAFGFFIMAVALSVTFRAEKYMKKYKYIFHFAAPALIIGAALYILPPSKNFPKANEVTTMPVAKYLHENCAKPCTFFAFHGDIETINQTALYTGYQHGTRFPSYWFLPQLTKQLGYYENGEAENAEHPLEYLEAIENKYSIFAAQDLESYKPSILMIGTNIDIFGNGEFFDYIAFFSKNDVFAKTLKENYTKTGTFEFDRAEYFRGTSMNQSHILTYDIYERKNKEN